MPLARPNHRLSRRDFIAPGPCSLFKDVTAIGWCNAWEKKA